MAVLGGLIAATAVYVSGQESETPIKRSELPPAVEKTVAAESAHATVKGFTREVENGQTYYEAELVVDGHARDVLMDEHGTIVEVEEQVAFDKLPAKVQAALRAHAGRGTIRVVESLTKNGKLVAYEAHVVTKGVRSEVQVGPNGETLDHEE
jgi:uncharacterized membrane protein YkoI